MSRDIDQSRLAPCQPNNRQNVELDEADGRHHEQIHCHDLRRMVVQECATVLVNCSTTGRGRGAEFSASSRHRDLSGEDNRLRSRDGSATVVTDGYVIQSPDL